MAEWNGWRTLAAYRTWVGWALVGACFAIAYGLGWIDGSIVSSIGQIATSVITALKGGGGG